MSKKIVLQTGDLLTHKDFEGNDLHVGDEVVACLIWSTISGSKLRRGIIEKETPKSIVTNNGVYLPQITIRTKLYSDNG